MLAPRKTPLAALGAAVIGAAAALCLHQAAPDPSADVARGGEDAFARGLHPRELPPRAAPLRWTRERATVRFRYLPRGPAVLEVEVQGHRAPVTVSADGVILGVIAPGAGGARFDLRDNGSRARDVELGTIPFRAGDGRDLGTQLRRVTLRPASRGAPPVVLVAGFAAVSLVAFAAAGAAGFGAAAALLLAAAVTLGLCLALGPAGIVRSAYMPVAASLLGSGCVGALAATRAAARRWPGIGRATYAGLLLAVLVQALAATSPLMVVSDAVFHANNLARVAGGDLWITSRTQHSPPFRFPYGVSFYLLLAPLYRLGLDAVWLVRGGAALAGLAGSAALLWLLAPRGDVRAGLGIAALQLLPVTFDLYSFGNLSNVFSQALTALAFAWWARGGPGGWPVGAVLVAAAGIGHLSSFIVTGVLAAALLIADRRERPRARGRVLPLAVGVGAAALYYAQFLPLIVEQLPRLREGSAAARSGRALAAPLLAIAGQWGLPALVLAVIGRPRPGRDPLERDLAAYWAAGGALALVALATPLEVRYLHALAWPLAVAAAEGVVRLWTAGLAGRLGAILLALAQAALAARNVAEAVLQRYRL
jgi:hypothetical protein